MNFKVLCFSKKKKIHLKLLVKLNFKVVFKNKNAIQYCNLVFFKKLKHFLILTITR